MNAQTKVEPFNAYAAYQREREYSRKLEHTLDTALSLLSMECRRRELRGEDVSEIRSFIKRAYQ